MKPEYNPMVDRLLDPWPVVAGDRARCPVAHVDNGDGFDFFQVTGYEELVSILRRPAVFVNRFGTVPQTMADPTASDRQVLPQSDPPIHTRHRRLVVKALSPARIDAMEAHIEQVCDELIDRLPPDGGSFELIEQFNAPLVVTIIAEMLGVPLEDRARFREWTRMTEQAAVVADPTPYLADMQAFIDYLQVHIDQRRSMGDAPDDLTTALVHVEDGGEQLQPHEVVGLVRVLLAAGNSTTVSLIANLVWLLDRFPEEKAKLLADIDGRAAGAVEETLRFDPSIHGLFRVAVEEAEVGGVTLPAGARIFNCYGAGNHDPDAFPEPDRFVIDRDWEALPPHLGFGLGIHHCVGSNLARKEAGVAVRHLYERLPGLRVKPGFVPTQIPGIIFRAWESLEVEYDGPVRPRRA